MGGNQKKQVFAYQQEGVPLIPATIHEVSEMHHIFDPNQPADLADENLPEAWTNLFQVG